MTIIAQRGHKNETVVDVLHIRFVALCSQGHKPIPRLTGFGTVISSIPQALCIMTTPKCVSPFIIIVMTNK